MHGDIGRCSIAASPSLKPFIANTVNVEVPTVLRCGGLSRQAGGGECIASREGRGIAYMPTYSYRTHVNGHAPPAGRPRAKQQRQSRCRREIRATHTDTLLRIHAHIPPSLCASAARLLFLSLPCFPLNPPSACRVSKLFPLSLSKSRGAAAAGTATLWRGGGGNQIPVAKSRTIRLQHKRGRELRNVQEDTSSATRKSARLGEGGASAHRAWLKKFQSYSVQRRNSRRWACLAAPHPNSEPGVRPFAPPGPS